MRVAFDQQVFLLQEYGGISRYICSLASHLSRMPNVDARVIAPLHFNQHLEVLPTSVSTGLKLPKVPPKAFRLVSFASKYLARFAINRFNPHVIHESYFSMGAFAPRGARRVVTVYDMIHERFPSMFERSYMTSDPKRVSVVRADHVICISESTRRDLIEFFGIPEEKTSVVYLGCDDFFLDVARRSVDRDTVTGQPYLLYVGGRDGYKNFSGFLRAFASSEYLKGNFSIVCFGGGVLRGNELSLIADLKLPVDAVRQCAGDDSVLAGLYQGAAAFVYPSLYEGFGIPPLEAMSQGCPVICSDTSSIPEVVGGAGAYFDPSRIDSISNAIEQVMQSSEARATLIANGRAQCAGFSWARCAEETLAIYKRLV